LRRRWVFLLITLIGLVLRAGGQRHAEEQTIEPNVIPIVEATIVTPLFSGGQPWTGEASSNAPRMFD